jgi:hypothetical protein
LIPENARAAYCHRPARKVVTIADRSQTARKDLGPSEAEEDTLGIRRARKVER